MIAKSTVKLTSALPFTSTAVSRLRKVSRYKDNELVDCLVEDKTANGLSREHPDFPGKGLMQFKVFEEEAEFDESETEQETGVENADEESATSDADTLDEADKERGSPDQRLGLC